MTYKYLFTIILSVVLGTTSGWAKPRLLLEAGEYFWTSPIYSPQDDAIAYSNRELDQIWSLDLNGQTPPRQVARGTGIGGRFLFEPGDDRIVYRQRAMAHPDRPVRLMSTSIHIKDPAMRTSNMGEILGPYAFDGQVFFRRSLTEPYLKIDESPHPAGSYLNRERGRFWVLDDQGKRIYESPDTETVAAFEISPDGKRVAVIISKPTRAIFVVETMTGKRTEIGRGRWPGWSGNSARLIYVADSDTGPMSALYVYDFNLEKLTKIVQLGGLDPDTPSLNSDGSWALFSNKGSIYRVEVPAFP